jgi:hypothetical protein
MDIPVDEKHQRLQDVGMITADELPEEYASVVDSLTPDELETLVSVKKRLDLAQRASGTSIGDNFVAP